MFNKIHLYHLFAFRNEKGDNGNTSSADKHVNHAVYRSQLTLKKKPCSLHIFTR